MKEKQLYFAPECEEIRLALEGVIAQSALAPGLVAPSFEDGGDIFEI